jgi:sugar phosphate isomerase/epimerase
MSTLHSRRDFLQRATLAGAAAFVLPVSFAGAQDSAPSRKLKLSLSPGSIGVKADPRESIILAHRHGFEAVEPSADFLTGLSDTALTELRADLQSKKLVFGAAGLPVDFRGDEPKFRASLEAWPRLAAGLQRAGVDRVGTWISPGHGSLTYLQNFRQHARRLREVAQVLKDHGQRLGLEYVGTPTARQKSRYPFIHSMRETQDLIGEIGTGNVGYVLDSWHWWTAGETEADLLSLRAVDVISVDINDAPAGIPVEQQQDGKRELPCATGVIPLGVFLNALNRIGYDGPVRAEPFNQPLNELDNEAACAAVMAALRKAVALVK